MSLQHLGHLILGVAALAATLAISSLTVNRLVKRKLKLSVFLLGAYVVLHAGAGAVDDAAGPRPTRSCVSFERLAFAAGLINLLVIAFINPLRADRVPDRFPTILQDFIVIGLLLAGGDVRLARHAADDLRGERRGHRLRAAGHAGERVRRARHPEREAVPRRPLDPGRRRSRGGSPRSPGAPRSSGPSPATSSSCPTTSSRRKRSRTTRSRRRRRASRSRSARAT